jgi:tetratricopeptide (TPR) repeat protein
MEEKELMAKRRLNKKVVLIGSLIFVVFALAAIAAILYLSRSPERFIKDGDAALKAAREATEEQIKQEEYERAERNYHKARGLAKSDSLRVNIIFKLVDVYLETDEWRNVIGCWNGIIQIDPKNIKARYARLKYLYIMADSGMNRFWQEVASDASELIEVVEQAGLLMDDTDEWESFTVSQRQEQPHEQMMGSYLYLLKGRANLEIARRGAVTEPDKALAQAIDDLQKAQELQPDNVNIYWYLAQAITTKGEFLASRGDLEERDASLERAQKLLEDAVQIANSDVRAHINLLRMKAIIALRGDIAQVEEQFQLLEPEYLLLVDKFPAGAEAYLQLARFYRTNPKTLDKALQTVEKACELDEEDIASLSLAADLHYRKFSVYNEKQEIYKAVEAAEKALTLPDAQQVSGPRRWANLMNRISLYGFLADCYIEQILNAPKGGIEPTQKQKCLERAEAAVREIEQLYASGEEPQVIKWQGMLELARGNSNSAVRKLHAVFEQFKAANQRDSKLTYRLAKIFENTAEIGAATKFLSNALSISDRSVLDKIDETKPEALLDYANLMLKFKVYSFALGAINFFESNYWVSERSQRLRIEAYIGAKQFEQAEEALKKYKPDDPNAIKLKLAVTQSKIEQIQGALERKRGRKRSPLPLEEEQTDIKWEPAEGTTPVALRSYRDTLARLLKKLITIEPKSVEETTISNYIRVACDNYLAKGETDKARGLVNRWVECSPSQTTALFYKKLLSEPNPSNVSLERSNEIRVHVLSNITDPNERHMNLGMFYKLNNEPNKAVEEFQKILSSHLYVSDEAGLRETEEMPASQVPQTRKSFRNTQRFAASHLFDVALEKKDWELAEQISELARRENLDNVLGTFFVARIAAVRGRYKDALAKLDECLKQRPVFSAGFLLRSQVNDALGNERAAIEDAKKAASLNPLNGDTARRLAIALYRRNQKLGDNVSSGQIIETQNALKEAIKLNTGSLQLQLFRLYAEYISDSEPKKALAIGQYLQRQAPSIESARLLGRLATTIATETADQKDKEALFDIAASSFEQAMKINPHHKGMLYDFSEYYRARGQEQKAEQLLLESKESEMLWRYYFRTGQLTNARKLLEQLYQSDPKEKSVVKGLLLIAGRTGDKEAAMKYSEELLSLEDTIDNNLMQIHTLLRVGLVKEAEHKLESFNERYPDESRSLLLDAWLATKQGRLKEALELTNQHLELYEDNAEAWRLRGEINLRMTNYDQATIDLKKSKSLASEPMAQIALAKAYLGVGRNEDAITELENAIANPETPMEGRRLLERIYMQLGKGQDLLRLYDKTLMKFPGNIMWHNRAAAFAARTGNLNMAEQLYEKALQKSKKQNKTDGVSLEGYLRTLGLSRKLDKVLQEGRKYLDTELASVAYMQMAAAKLSLRDKQTAIQYCRRAIDKASGNEPLMFKALRRMYSLVGAQEVERYCKEKLETDPDSFSANMTMFNLMRISGSYNKALGYIDKCIEALEPDSQRAVNCIILKVQVLQSAYSKTSDKNYLNKAVAEYESMLQKMPNNTSVLNNLAYMLAENNEKIDEALEYAERAHKAQANNPDLMDTYGYVLYKNGKYSEAVEILHAAIQQYESQEAGVPTEVHEHLAQAYEKTGTIEEAVAAYKQAVQLVDSDKQGSEATKERINSEIERLLQLEESK